MRRLHGNIDRITAYDPDHLPREIELIEAFRERHPKLPQAACFDTTLARLRGAEQSTVELLRTGEIRGYELDEGAQTTTHASP